MPESALERMIEPSDGRYAPSRSRTTKGYGMTTAAATIDSLGRARSIARSGRESSTLRSEFNVIINQPRDTVLAFGRSGFGSSVTADFRDPEFSRPVDVLGKHFEIIYRAYEVPGGTQLTATVLGPDSGALDVLGIVADGAVRRRVEAQLTEMKDAME